MSFHFRTTISKEGRLQVPRKELEYASIEQDDWVFVHVTKISIPAKDEVYDRFLDDAKSLFDRLKEGDTELVRMVVDKTIVSFLTEERLKKLFELDGNEKLMDWLKKLSAVIGGAAVTEGVNAWASSDQGEQGDKVCKQCQGRGEVQQVVMEGEQQKIQVVTCSQCGGKGKKINFFAKPGETCRTCDGLGQVQHQEAPHEEIMVIACPICGGKGVYPKHWHKKTDEGEE